MKRISTAERLRSIMGERSLKQVDILKLCDPFCRKFDVKMNKSDISQYVAGKVEPSQDKLVILGMALNVTESWLMGFDLPPERNVNSPKQANDVTLSEYEHIKKYRLISQYSPDGATLIDTVLNREYTIAKHIEKLSAEQDSIHSSNICNCSETDGHYQ